MRPGLICIFVLSLLWPLCVAAQDRSFQLSAPADLIETGFLKHLLPRFSLKTGVRIEVIADGDTAAATLNAQGRGPAVFSSVDVIWHLQDQSGGNTHVARFADWITSDVGVRTIEAFQVEGTPLFNRPVVDAVVEEEIVFEGDAKAGETLALVQCGRCHVVGAVNRMKALGSTPSFALLRTFSDWESRFSAFFVLKPHPAFTQVEDITEPFDKTRPPPISPLLITLDDLDAIMAFVAQIEPANLGAPIQSQ